MRTRRQRVCGGAHGGRRGGAVAGVVTRTSRGTVPNRTVQYRTILCLTLQQEHTAKQILPCLSQRKPGGKKAAVGNRRKCGKLCGKRVENLFQGAQAATGGRGRGGQPDGYFRPGVVRRVRSGGQERCARAWMRWGRRRFWRQPGAAEHGAVPTGGMCGRGRGFWSGTVWRALSAGAGVVDAFGWRVVAAGRCGTRVQRRARWLAFLLREKMLDKLCKSILNWKQGITQAAAGDGLRHRPHRRSCTVYHTSTSSVAATSVMRCAFDARLSGAALRKTETKNSAQHRFDAGRSFVTAAAQARRPFRWLSGGLSAGYPARRPFRWLSCAAAFSQPFLCACGHRAAFLTQPSRSCPRATPRTGCAYGRSGGRTPSSPATTAGRTR